MMNLLSKTTILFFVSTLLGLLPQIAMAEDAVELKNPLYLEFQKELDEAKKELDAELKAFEEHKAAVEKAVPQTGQIKYAQKRYYESLSRQNRAKQRILYQTIKLNTQRTKSRLEHKQAAAQDKPWPDPAKHQEYMDLKALRQRTRIWSASERRKLAGLDSKKPNKKSEPKEKQSTEAGGH